MVAFFFFGVASVLLASPTAAYRPGDQICTYATSNASCSLERITPSTTDGSVLIYPGGKTRCAFDDFKDPATGYSTNATYFFQVFPKPQKKKLALILQGGGACIDQATCSFALQCSLPSPPVFARASASSVGILNVSDPRNAFNDWNIVNVPYCTGDLHVGNMVLDPYESGLESQFGRPQCLGLERKMYLNGFENTKAAFHWAMVNYPDIEELVLGGMSGGALGSQLLAAYAADMWSVKAKGISYSVLVDSYVGVFPASKPMGSALHLYGACEDVGLPLPASVMSQCKADTLTMVELTSTMLQTLPRSTWLFLSSMGDDTQRLFYQLAKDGMARFPFANQISVSDFFDEATEILDGYKQLSAHVSTFLVNGTQHVFLNRASWYETVSTTGDMLGAYVAKWLASVGTGTEATGVRCAL